ncbi:MAG: polymer-forming cytoskeletal protein [Chloroflexales bacterium]|nr:polymer-forming cytoskeletal protein [Chloroflexales bacterium]
MLATQLWRWSLVGLCASLLALAMGQSPASAAFGFGDTYRLSADQVLPKDLYVIANDIVIEGTVEGDLAVIGRRVLITGTVKGNTNVLAARIELSGYMHGFIRTIGAAQITPPADTPGPARRGTTLPTRFAPASILAQDAPPLQGAGEDLPWRTTALIALGFALLGAALLWLAPQALNGPARRLEGRPWLTALIGLLTAQFFLLIPLGTALLAALMAFFWSWFPAILLVVFIFTGFGLIWFLSPLITGVWLGRRLNAGMGRAPESRVMQVLAVVLVALLGQIPTIGIFVYLASFVLTVGALAAPRRPAELTAAVPIPQAAPV